MLDALKFAFEILIVGVMALPWLAVLSWIFPFDSSLDRRIDLSIVPEPARNAVAVAVVIAFGYLLGSAVSRFSRDFFNDELWKPFPTEDMIRDNVYFDEFCSEHAFVYQYWSKPIHLEPPPKFCPDQETKEKLLKTKPGKLAKFSELSKDQLGYFDQEVQEAFLLEESELLLQGLDKVDRLKQYYDQITVLRGAAFNGFILFTLCIFGSCGALRALWSGHRIAKALTLLPACIVGIFAFRSFWIHLHGSTESLYSDPPLAELVFLLLAGVGFVITLKADAATPYLRICIVSAVVTAISFGGWWWTEVMYDLQVIHSLPELKQTTGAPAPVVEILKSPNASAPSAPAHSGVPAPSDEPASRPTVH
jgi:hypothetical protein